jgi:hypothetical protein
MRGGGFQVLLVGLVAVSAPANAADKLCEKLQVFERSKPARSSERRWFEFHWGFEHVDALWSWGCRHSQDDVANATCKWLVDNTNQEFSMMLPLEIMRCYGYGIPPHASYDWADMAARTWRPRSRCEDGATIGWSWTWTIATCQRASTPFG